MQGRNKSNLLLLLLYRLPSNNFWPSKQTISTIIREEDRAGGSAVSFPVNPAPSSQLPSEQGPAVLTGTGNNKRRLVRRKKGVGIFQKANMLCFSVKLFSDSIRLSDAMTSLLDTLAFLLLSHFCCSITSIAVVSILADIQI